MGPSGYGCPLRSRHLPSSGCWGNQHVGAEPGNHPPVRAGATVHRKQTVAFDWSGSRRCEPALLQIGLPHEAEAPATAICRERKPSLVTAASLLLDGRARHRTIGAKNAAVAHLGFKQCLAIPTLVEILARVCRHDFFVPLPAARARKNGLQDNGAHGLAITAVMRSPTIAWLRFAWV